MPTLIITVDPQCCRCITKLQNILCCIQDRGEFVIDKISYEKDKVLVSGPFDAQKLYCKLLCKAGKIIKGIEVAKPPPPKSDPPKPDPKPDPPKCKLVPWPYPYYPYPYPQHPPLTWPPCECGCPTSHCECHSKPPLPPPLSSPSAPPPAPAPLKPPTCVCPTWPSCHCSSCPPTPMPYPAMLVCEENPPYGACTVM